jgi:hypothetical protein
VSDCPPQSFGQLSQHIGGARCSGLEPRQSSIHLGRSYRSRSPNLLGELSEGLKGAFLLLVILMALAGLARASDFSLEVPVACEIGTTCWVQQYPDHDAGPGTVDYTCGTESYDGHDGTDIRIKTTKGNVDVIASAAGVVRGMRDGMPDHLMQSEADRAAVANIECGNGVVLVHPGGWETQYCHMRNGSVVVKRGEKVETGQKLGEVGYSGAAAFAHVHLSVRKNGRKIDPFGGAITDACGVKVASLWSQVAAKALDYTDRSVLDLGFLPDKAVAGDLESGVVKSQVPAAAWPAMVAYFWAINLEKGDNINVILDGPGDVHAENPQVLNHSKAQYVLFAGLKRPEAGWPVGAYAARLEIRHDGVVVVDRSVTADVK